MYYIILSLILLWIVYSVARWYQQRGMGRTAADTEEGKRRSSLKEPPADACCGQHAVCARSFLSEAGAAPVSQALEYYNDEELDAYRNVSPDDFSEQALDEFREVLYTLRTTEVAGWLASLDKRGVALPSQIKEEAVMILSE